MLSKFPVPQANGCSDSGSSQAVVPAVPRGGTAELKDLMDKWKGLAEKPGGFCWETERFELRAVALLGKAGLSELQFAQRGAVEDLDKAIEYRNQVLSLTPDGHMEKPKRLYLLGTSYYFRFNHFGKVEDIDKAIECETRAVFHSPDGDPLKPKFLNDLGISYQLRFERIGHLEDVDRAIYYQTKAVLLTPDDHAEKPSWLSKLRNSHMDRFKHLGELVDADKAIDYQTQALLTPDGSTDKPGRLNNLGASYLGRFHGLGKLGDIEEAMKYLIQAVELTPDGHPDKPALLGNLGTTHHFRFERLGELVDVNEAIEYKNQALFLIPDGHPDKPGSFNGLGNSYLRRFESLGELADVNKAIECQYQAAMLNSDEHPDKPMWLNSLGTSYLGRFKHLGELPDVDRAIECGIKAIALTQDGQAVKSIWLNSLGVSYSIRFQRLGEPGDLNKAIDTLTRAVLLTPEEHPEKPSWLSNLGNSYQSRFHNFGELADINKAIEHLTQAVELTPDDHPDKPARLSNLGIGFLGRFDRLGKLADVDKAIEYETRAVSLTSDGHVDKPARLGNLGNSYVSRFEHLGNFEDAEMSIECHTQAVVLTPDGHTNKSGHLNNLGNTYLSRFVRLRNTTDIEFAMTSFQRAAQYIVTKPARQVSCARKWALCSLSLGLSPQAAYERCMEIIPHMIWVGTTVSQRYSLLVEFNDLATEAAAWAISVQAYGLAIEWLEEGRAIVWNQILQLRTPFDDLAAVDPLLARDLKNVASQLEGAGSRPAETASFTHTSSDPEMDAQRHRRLAAEWEQLLAQARKIPGYQSFMSPRKADQIKLAATDGPIVLINIDTSRCDALVIFPQCAEVTHIPLEDISTTRLDEARFQLGSLVGHQGDRSRGFKRSNPAPGTTQMFKSVLATVWIEVVKPVLDFLGFTKKLPIEELPHVTWCTTGVLSFLPLHAAGLYDDSEPIAMDLVVSSYTPTLSALLFTTGPVSSNDFGMLAVGQEHTPGFSSLPSTVKELAVVKDHFEAARFQQLDGVNATVDVVLDAMEKHSCVHLACHATQNPVTPAHSAFHLHNGQLTLETITKRAFTNKSLAFLSACQTATGDDKLPEESVHLAAGMLMAGYPSVVATMWSIYDEDAPWVAEQVYAELMQDGKLNHRKAARALHKAVSSLRERVGDNEFKRWVPFIHIGL